MPSRSVRARLVLPLLLALLGTGCGAGAPADRSSAPTTATTSTGSAAPSSPYPLATQPPPPSPPVTTAPAPPAAVPVVVLDPGHNGGNAGAPDVVGAPVPDGTGGTKPCNTTGTATDAGYPEHAFAWDVSLRVRDRLTAAGVQVVLTRPDDEGVGPCVDARAAVAAQVGAALFVGVHGDGAAASGSGFHVITSSRQPAGAAVAADSDRLAGLLRDSLRAVEPVSDYLGEDGLDARPDLAGLNLNTVPAVYVECGNMRNATDAAWMSSPEGRQRVADRIAAGVLTYLGS